MSKQVPIILEYAVDDAPRRGVYYFKSITTKRSLEASTPTVINEAYDIISRSTVTGGTAACIVASPLAAADENSRILLLEAGLTTYNNPAHTDPLRLLSYLALNPRTVRARFSAECGTWRPCHVGSVSVTESVPTDPRWGSKDLVPFLRKNRATGVAYGINLLLHPDGPGNTRTYLERSGIGAKDVLERVGVKQRGKSYQGISTKRPALMYFAADGAQVLDALIRNDEGAIDDAFIPSFLDPSAAAEFGKTRKEISTHNSIDAEKVTSGALRGGRARDCPVHESHAAWRTSVGSRVRTAFIVAHADGPVPFDAPRIAYSEEDERAVATGWHSLGTCPMKPRDGGAIVDAKLNMYGVSGLKIPRPVHRACKCQREYICDRARYRGEGSRDHCRGARYQGPRLAGRNALTQAFLFILDNSAETGCQRGLDHPRWYNPPLWEDQNYKAHFG
ncbi:hypothetical protein EDB87DRAFT_1577474 [Lactarius vividus]|nr:hypothetical protein EDB87DRAFT_1577474 [Lactarius vividus]